MSERHPFIQGLLATLPEAGAAWPLETRVAWLQLAAQSFKLIYQGAGDIRVVAEAPAIAAPRVAAAPPPVSVAQTDDEDQTPGAAAPAAKPVSADVKARAQELVDKVRAETTNPTTADLWLWMTRLWGDLGEETKGKIFMRANTLIKVAA